eukprot:TRINITY_DN1983_c0_g1_i1.p1 TRINITY_DN1983_c0_g1~~TRINITY_DN1983_c0_g1_i1.p1  ORF type:complete len:139 (-),score=43.94 TRINITY_DN1983_c0_g1_i1:305-679(-)
MGHLESLDFISFLGIDLKYDGDVQSQIRSLESVESHLQNLLSRLQFAKKQFQPSEKNVERDLTTGSTEQETKVNPSPLFVSEIFGEEDESVLDSLPISSAKPLENLKKGIQMRNVRPPSRRPRK